MSIESLIATIRPVCQAPEEELPEEDNPDYVEDHEDVNAGVMAAPYLRESYLDIASRIASALLLLLC